MHSCDKVQQSGRSGASLDVNTIRITEARGQVASSEAAISTQKQAGMQAPRLAIVSSPQDPDV